jgi:hypothetical protein
MNMVILEEGEKNSKLWNVHVGSKAVQLSRDREREGVQLSKLGTERGREVKRH